jgi:signal transduction histidine kinase
MWMRRESSGRLRDPLSTAPETKVRRSPWSGDLWPGLASAALAILLFVGDVLIPRGATPAIGYCAIPLLASGVKRRGFVFGMTIACTVFTWVGYLVEPGGGAAWMSGFDRIMVTGALWLIFYLVSYRNQVVAALAQQTLRLEETKRELERSNSELDSFASVVAHDIEGPLHTIGLFAHLLRNQDSTSSASEIAEWASDIQSEIRSLSRLIQSLLNYGRIGGGRIRLESCDCEAVLDSLRRDLRFLLAENCAQVTNDPLPTLQADPALMAELFQNLIQNAIKYRRTEPPTIHVSASEQPEGWRFSVRDNGLGIQADDLERIFQPFAQCERAGANSGVGLGLATCKRIVERHGGHIEAHSVAGAGSTFTFTIGCGDSPKTVE